MSLLHHRVKRGPVWPQDFDNTRRSPLDGLTDRCRYNGVTSVKECFTGTIDVLLDTEFPPSFFKMSNIGLNLGVILYTLITLFCFVLSTFFTILLIKGWKSHFQYPIYRIILQLSICYSLISLSQFATNIPLYAFNFNSEESITATPFFIEQTACYASLLFYTLLTVNRLAIFTAKWLRDMFFGSSLYVLIAVCWCLALSASSFMMSYGCRRIYDDVSKIYVDTCAAQPNIFYTIYKLIFYLYFVLPVTNLILYILIAISIVLSRRKSTIAISRAEIDLLKQSALFFVLYTITIIIILIQPLIKFEYVITVYITSLLISAMDPILGVLFVGTFLGTNRTVRRAIEETMPPKISRFVGRNEVEPEVLFMKTSSVVPPEKT